MSAFLAIEALVVRLREFSFDVRTALSRFFDDDALAEKSRVVHFDDGFVGVMVVFVFLESEDCLSFNGGNKTYDKSVAALESHFLDSAEGLEVFAEVFFRDFPGKFGDEDLWVFCAHFWVYNLSRLC